MSETPQTQRPSAEQVPPQTRGQEPRTTAPPPTRAEAAAARPSAWVGWIFFAAMMLIMTGAFQIIMGLTALVRSGYYLVGPNDLLVSVNFTAWGWTHIGVGVLAIAAAFGLLAGQLWARVVGIALALVSAIVNLAFIEAYPLWSIMVIALDVVVIYAIAMHGSEMRAVTRQP